MVEKLDGHFFKPSTKKYAQRRRENHGKHIRKFLEVLVTFHIHHPFVSYFLLRPQFRPSYPSSIHQISSAAIFFSRCQDGSKSSDACCSWWQKKSQQPRKMAILVPHRNLKKHRSISPTCQHVATCRRGIPTSSWIQRFLLCQFQGSTPQFTKLGLTENRVPPKAESCCWFCWVILFQNWHSHKLGVYPTFSHTNILNFENAVAAAPSKLQRSRSFGHFSTAHFFRSRRKMILLETFHWRCYTCHTWTSETWQNTYQDSSSSTSGTHWNPKNDKQRQHPWFPRGLIAWTWPP